MTASVGHFQASNHDHQTRCQGRMGRYVGLVCPLYVRVGRPICPAGPGEPRLPTWRVR